jgi:two-component system, chemotaxis family, sensor kinase CheA
MYNKTSWMHWGKYREIVIAVALFVVLDLSILGLNFYTSFQIDQDTVAINLSGRQRYTSQRIARTLLELDAARAAGQPYDPATLAELRNGAEIFQRSMIAFHEGGVVPGGDGKPVQLEAVTSPRGRELESRVEALWGPYYALLQPVIANETFADEVLGAALRYSQANNLALLGVTNEFVTETQAIGASRAARLRTIQTAGLLLALLNFAFILFKFLRRLNENDRRIEAAQKETTEILATVKEGLFLLGADFHIGSQFSASLRQILGRPVEPGSDFRVLLRSMVSPSIYAAACDYIGLLLGDRVRESLVTSLNPLSAIGVEVPSEGGTAKRFLTLQFNRVRVNDKISHLLVTVLDVTRQVELEQALGDVKKRSRSEIEVMLDLLKVHPASLKYFLDSAERKLLEVNDHLRNIGADSMDYRRSIAAIFRLIHALKGEAAVLGLDMFEGLAQQFEVQLAALRDKDSMSGEDLVALPLPLDEFLQRVMLARELMTRLASYHDAFSGAGEDGFVESLGTLARRIASDHGKEVQLIMELDLFNTLPRKVQSGLQDIVVQLMRNAVVHGIEAPTERSERSKSSAGNIYVTLRPVGAGEFEFVMRDDGRGLMPPRIRTALRESGRYTEDQLQQFDDRQIVMKIFDAGFSTAAPAGRDAGHGVGMDVVKQKIEQLGARLRITTRDNMFTQFSIRFAV